MTGGSFRNNNTVVEAIARTGDSTWKDYSLSLKARRISGEEGFIVYFLMSGETQCLWNIGGWGNSVDVLMQDRVDLGKEEEGILVTA